MRYKKALILSFIFIDTNCYLLYGDTSAKLISMCSN